MHRDIVITDHVVNDCCRELVVELWRTFLHRIPPDSQPPIPGTNHANDPYAQTAHV